MLCAKRGAGLRSAGFSAWVKHPQQGVARVPCSKQWCCVTQRPGVHPAALLLSWSCCRPYLYTSYVGGGIGLLYVAVKAFMYSYPLAWLPPAVLMITFATLSWLHILAAR